MSFASWIRALAARLRGPAAESTGTAGEQAAARWLEKNKGFAILARNWRARIDRRLELDLVARDGETLVFVEVKTRPASALVPGYVAAVHPKKKKAVLRAARAYVRALRRRPHTVRYDVVEVMHGAAGGEALEVLHFENVPLFPKEFLRGVK